MKSIEHYEIQDLFDEFEPQLDKRTEFSFQDYATIQSKPFWECGIKFMASDAWVLFRARAKTTRRWDNLIFTLSLLISGEHSIRQVSKISGYAKNTVCGLARKFNVILGSKGLDKLKCKCGKDLVSHRGWCSYRFNKSKSRQTFIKNWNKHDRIPTTYLHAGQNVS